MIEIIVNAFMVLPPGVKVIGRYHKSVTEVERKVKH
jgi:hypothetical protein